LHENDTLKRFDSSGNIVWKKKLSGLPILLDKSKFAYIDYFKTPFEYNYYYQNTVRLNSFDIDNNNQNSYLIAHTDDGFIGGFINKGHNGEILISGKFWGSVSFYSSIDTVTISNYDSTSSAPGHHGPLAKEFIAKIDTSGNTIWIKHYNGKGPIPYILKTNTNGEIFTAGFLVFSANFDPAGSRIITNGDFGNYIAKYDSSFNYLACATFLGGSYNDFIGGIEFYNDTAIIFGQFFGKIDVDLTNNNYFLTASFPEDIFVAKYSNFDITTNPVSVNEVTNKLSKIDVFPNPSTGVYYLKFNKSKSNPLLILSDIYGRKIISKEVDRDGYALDISRYRNGIYLLTIIQGSEKTSVKLVKQD